MIRHPEAQALRSCPGALLAVGDQDLIAYASPEALRLTGWDLTLVGQPVLALVPPELREQHRAAYADVAATRRRIVAYPRIHPTLGKDGQLRQVYVNVAAFERPDGSLFMCSVMAEPKAAPPSVDNLRRCLEAEGYRFLTAGSAPTPEATDLAPPGADRAGPPEHPSVEAPGCPMHPAVLDKSMERRRL